MLDVKITSYKYSNNIIISPISDEAGRRQGLLNKKKIYMYIFYHDITRAKTMRERLKIEH